MFYHLSRIQSGNNVRSSDKWHRLSHYWMISWLKMSMCGLKQVRNRVNLSGSSPWTNFTLHWIKHFVNPSLAITHLLDVITRLLLVKEVRSKHWRYWEKRWSFSKCSMISVSHLQLLHWWLFYLMIGHVWYMAERNTQILMMQGWRSFFKSIRPMISVIRLDDNMPPPRSRFLLQKIRKTNL